MKRPPRYACSFTRLLIMNNGHLLVARVGVMIAMILAFFIGIALSCVLFLWFSTPDVSWLVATNPTKTAMMRYKESVAQKLQRHYAIHYDFVPLSRISTNLQLAVVMGEDPLFFSHSGFDWESISYAIKHNFEERNLARGGSSITQQLAKNLFLQPTPRFLRKLPETIITIKLERALTKPRILELYLNVSEWGDGIYGAKAAARAYYQKPASELSLEESIRLASILCNPGLFTPTEKSHFQYLRRFVITRKLYRHGFIDKHMFSHLKQKLLQ